MIVGVMRTIGLTSQWVEKTTKNFNLDTPKPKIFLI